MVSLYSCTTVHVVFTNHLDVGYNNLPVTGFIANVVNFYFDIYIPRAISTADAMRKLGSDRFIWTTHSWLISFYVDCPLGLGFHCPNSTTLSLFTAAVQRGDITWHAYPFNSQQEMMEESLFEYGVKMTHELDTMLKVNKKTVLSQRDVPGLTRSVIPILKKNGILGITIGLSSCFFSLIQVVVLDCLIH